MDSSVILTENRLPKISIIMAYYNRREQTLFTLDTINKSVFRDSIEVIIVDDGSDMDHDLSIVLELEYGFVIKLYKLNDIKTWVNSVIPYNIAISKINPSSEWIIIQNPEVCHIGDIPSYIMSNGNTEHYYAFHVFACKNENNNKILRSMALKDVNINKLSGVWYCHEKYRNRPYHFCTAIHKSKLEKVGGFNPIMKDGVGYDDNEFLERIKRVCEIKYVDTPYGIHQWHPIHYKYGELSKKNRDIFNKAAENKTITYISPGILPGTIKVIYSPNISYSVTD
jgi:hypothetical protein